MTYSYRAFGYSILSNVSIPGLVPAAPRDAEIRIELGVRPPDSSRWNSEELTFESSIFSDSGKPVMRIYSANAGRLTHIAYEDGVEFWFEEKGERVWGYWPESLALGDAVSYLLGPVFGLMMRLRGVVCLHASAVAMNEQAVLFMGESGSGKSTTAAVLAAQGCGLISDDIVPIVPRDGAFYAVPAYPFLCLWPDSVNLLMGEDPDVPVFSPSYAKRQLTTQSGSFAFQDAGLPISCIFLLDLNQTDVTALERLSIRDAFLCLVANSYGTYALASDLRAAEFELFGQLVKAIPIWRLRAHTPPDQLCQLVNNHVAPRISPARSL